MSSSDFFRLGAVDETKFQWRVPVVIGEMDFDLPQGQDFAGPICPVVCCCFPNFRKSLGVRLFASAKPSAPLAAVLTDRLGVDTPGCWRWAVPGTGGMRCPRWPPRLCTSCSRAVCTAEPWPSGQSARPARLGLGVWLKLAITLRGCRARAELRQRLELRRWHWTESDSLPRLRGPLRQSRT